jgi:ketosteroid isomerase-like protein
MSEQLRARIYDLYTAFSKGKFDFVLNSFDDKAEFISYAPIELFPYLGRQHGKAAIAETMKKIHEKYELLSYQPISLLVEKDDAGVIVMVRLRQRGSGRVIQLLLAHFIRFRNGRIVELREFMDSFDAVQQVLGREICAASV